MQPHSYYMWQSYKYMYLHCLYRYGMKEHHQTHVLWKDSSIIHTIILLINKFHLFRNHPGVSMREDIWSSFPLHP